MRFNAAQLSSRRERSQKLTNRKTDEKRPPPPSARYVVNSRETFSPPSARGTTVCRRCWFLVIIVNFFVFTLSGRFSFFANTNFHIFSPSCPMIDNDNRYFRPARSSRPTFYITNYNYGYSSGKKTVFVIETDKTRSRKENKTSAYSYTKNRPNYVQSKFHHGENILNYCVSINWKYVYKKINNTNC